MPGDERHDPTQDATDPGDAARYEPPELTVYDADVQIAWANDRDGESQPDDTLHEAPESNEAPKVLGWTAPQPEYALGDPEVFAAPANPKRKVSPPKKEFPKTDLKGKTTRTRATKTKLTGSDAFGGALCTCDLVCTCNLVCTCQAVATCSCVGHAAPADTCSCVGHTSCSCVGDTCACVGYSPCEIHEPL